MKGKKISHTKKKNVDLIITHSIKNEKYHLDASADMWNVVLYRSKIRLRAKVSGVIQKLSNDVKRKTSEEYSKNSSHN